MAENTKIEWTDCTFNPWWGCQKVSPACDHCYAERDAKRFAPGRVLWGVDSERRIFADKQNGKNDHWDAPLKWAKTLPAKLGRRPRVFCASMADWLDLDAPLSEFVRLLDTIRRTPELDWLQLSKRIGNLTGRLHEADGFILGVMDAQAERADRVPTGEVGRADDRRARAYLEGREAHRRSMERRDEGDVLQAGSRGAGDARGLSAGPGDDRRPAALCSSGATGVAALQWANPAGADGEPQARQQARQPAGESGAGDVQRTAVARGQGSWRKGMGPSGVEASEDDVDRGAGDCDAASAKGRRNGQRARGPVRNQRERGIADLPWGDLEALLAWIAAWLDGKPPANVWIGSTVVNQEEADRDIPKLLQVPARVRFLSIEPMLGPIDLRLRRPARDDDRQDMDGFCSHITTAAGAGIKWVICGGESGPGARPMHPDWARSLRDQCKAAGVAFLLKQWGEWAQVSESPVHPEATRIPGNLCRVTLDGVTADHYVAISVDGGRKRYELRRVGKRAAGRLLDGIEHNEFPELA